MYNRAYDPEVVGVGCCGCVNGHILARLTVGFGCPPPYVIMLLIVILRTDGLTALQRETQKVLSDFLLMHAHAILITYLKGAWGVAKMITGSSQNWLHLWQYLI